MYGKVQQRCVRGVGFHLCAKTQCTHGQDIKVHLGEWVYLSSEDTEAALAAMQPGDAATMMKMKEALESELMTTAPESDEGSTTS